jgi:hypothetical protein
MRGMQRSYFMARAQQITERGPVIGKCDGKPIYEWIRLAHNPAIKYEFAGMAPQPVPATLYEPGITVMALVVGPGLAYEAAR